MPLDSIAIRLFITMVLLGGCTPSKPPEPIAAKPPVYVGAEVCAGCHQNEYQRWQTSHHDLAMQQATNETVLGDFANVKFQYGDIESTFFRADGRFYVSTDNANGQLADHEITYTFGVDPLQQYLIKFPDGRLQALSIAWDSRTAEQGGQRWFHLYPGEQIDHTDVLHWTGPLQNWNFMCAECHSTNVHKNYVADENTFATSSSEINVACEACHGPGSIHATETSDSSASTATSASTMLAFENDGSWQMDSTTGIARRSPARQSTTEIETCARCHSRRSVTSEDYVHGDALMNTHRPSLLEEDLYYADGQIQDEVYVYGSFLQSKMYLAGVTCADCHDAHSLQLTATGNSLCAQCHLPSVFDTEAHHRHEPTSDGAQCVNCHMSTRNYMVVDGRRDHSFRRPRPDLTTRIGTPNACNSCHDDQDAEWASNHIENWIGGPQSQHYGEVIDAGRRQTSGVAAQLAELANDEGVPPIVRATAIELLGENAGPERASALERASQSEYALIRMAAADAAHVLGPTNRFRIIAPLLNDSSRAVRLSAAAALMQVPRAELLQSQANDLATATEEYRKAQLLNADRAEANVNLGVLYTLEGDTLRAEQAYQHAMRIAPSFAPAYVNLADFYRESGREDDIDAVLNRGLVELPNSPDLHHSLGLSLVRRGNYETAIASLQRAHELRPDDARYAYVLGVALNSTGDSAEAIAVLREAHALQPSDRDLLIALATMSRDAGQQASALEFAHRLLELAPNDSVARQLVSELSRP